MTIAELLQQEFAEESSGSRRILERVPEASFSWKPHEKSMTLGRLASHVADLPNRCVTIVTTDTFVRNPGTAPFLAASADELLSHFDEAAAAARVALESLREDQLSAVWTLKFGERTIAALPRALALRRVFMNHLIHHRGQLGVYLRLLDAPVPGMYGPSADDAR
ncbi:MAG: DinB family protein [Acidobacteriaceae bacterium]